mmetsp:Transcript_28774/g.47315  ORF Transcript_28774/g.47315 Transcript_28774/m.47315 type:complete len:86 (+) Transcript_28774:190-447(+)
MLLLAGSSNVAWLPPSSPGLAGHLSPGGETPTGKVAPPPPLPPAGGGGGGDTPPSPVPVERGGGEPAPSAGETLLLGDRGPVAGC